MTDADAMHIALSIAREAFAMGEVPVGAVVLNPGGEVIGRGGNRREVDRDPTAHAEIVALREAALATGYWRLVDCTLVVTLEPCPMCAGALVNARVKRLVYATADPKAGAVNTLYNLCQDARLNHRIEVASGVLAEESAQLLRQFFRERRGI